MLKTYQFKTHCKGDSHSSKTANITLPGLMIKQRWTTLRLQAKYSRLRLFNLGGMSCFNQHSSDSLNTDAVNDLSTISLADVRSFTFVLSWVLPKWYLQF